MEKSIEKKTMCGLLWVGHKINFMTYSLLLHLVKYDSIIVTWLGHILLLRHPLPSESLIRVIEKVIMGRT